MRASPHKEGVEGVDRVSKKNPKPEKVEVWVCRASAGVGKTKRQQAKRIPLQKHAPNQLKKGRADEGCAVSERTP